MPIMAKVGIIHVHSNFSYDGQHTLDEIASFAKKRGYSFVGMTEHSDTFDEHKMSHFVQQCRRLSGPSLLMIPGLEFTCDDNLHLLALGTDRFTATKNPISVARFIAAQGGLAILSHPSRYDYRMPLGLETEITGIEIWNASYDGRFLPNERSIELWQALRRRNPSLCALGGQDLHKITAHCHVKMMVPCDQLRQETILQKLKEANCVISNSYLRVRPTQLPRIKLHSITWMRRAYIQAKAIRDCFAQ